MRLLFLCGGSRLNGDTPPFVLLLAVVLGYVRAARVDPVPFFVAALGMSRRVCGAKLAVAFTSGDSAKLAAVLACGSEFCS